MDFQKIEAYPKSVGAVQMDYSSKEIMKIDVTMMFKYWRASEDKFDVVTQPTGDQIKAPPVKSEVDIKNPYKDPKLPFGLPGIPSDVLKLPKLTSFF